MGESRRGKLGDTLCIEDMGEVFFEVEVIDCYHQLD